MSNAIEVLGPELFARDESGQLRSRIGTFFPDRRVLVTLPGIHATQRSAFIEWLGQQREGAGLPPLTPEEEAQELARSVDLFFEPRRILIRPDPNAMGLAFEADTQLQSLASKRCIGFLFVLDPRVQQPIKERGECWRISALPQSPADMCDQIAASRGPIREQPVYYYSRNTGIRYLTLREFERFAALDAGSLARQLQEVADHCRARNRLGNPEVDFFAADPLRFGARDFAGTAYLDLGEEELRARHDVLCRHFREAVDPALRVDDPGDELWRNRMFTALAGLRDDTRVEEVLRGLSPEFFLQIDWLPGGRFEDGEFVFDPVYDETESALAGEGAGSVCDSKARGFVFNFIREYGDLDYINVGCVIRSLSQRPQNDGRRGVYIAELKPHNQSEPIVRFIRLLKWGVREHLDEGHDLLRAMLESEEYIDYFLDRRLGCRQLGMNVAARVIIRSVPEVYDGKQAAQCRRSIHTWYAERDYIRGVATDKIKSIKYLKDGFAARLGMLLGHAAASNIIVGRTYDENGGVFVVFDDGDEVVTEDPDGLPSGLVVGDHSGAFGEYRRPLIEFAPEYAQPVNERLDRLPDAAGFAARYLSAFRDQFRHVQGDYRKRRSAFDRLFQHSHYDPAGSFAFRWEQVLGRLDATDGDALVEAIRRHIKVDFNLPSGLCGAPVVS